MPEYFPCPKIKFEGTLSSNDLAFQYYNPEQLVGVKSMKDHLRFAASFWHTFMADGSDPFGAGTMQKAWNDIPDPMERSRARADAAFEFMSKLGIEYFCFHDYDIAPEGNSLAEKNRNLDEMVVYIKSLMQQTGIKLLWGTSNTFTHPRFVHGAATSCNADVFAFAAAQIK